MFSHTHDNTIYKYLLEPLNDTCRIYEHMYLWINKSIKTSKNNKFWIHDNGEWDHGTVFLDLTVSISFLKATNQNGD